MSTTSSKRQHLSPLRTDVSSSGSSSPVSPSYSDVSPTTCPEPRRVAFPPLRPCKKVAPPVVHKEKRTVSYRQEEGRMENRTREHTMSHLERRNHQQYPVRPHADVPPTVTITPSPSSSASSVNTYDSSLSLDNYEEGDEIFDASSEASSASRHRLFPFLSTSTADDDAAIPPCLPAYRRASVSGDPASCFLRASTPHAFGRLFPSLDRLSVRHDDLTMDGNMNLRVDTPLIPGSRRPVQYQLFHLRMHDLARREFSLRRYCRDSGREVCNSKREYALQTPAQRSVTSAIRSVKSPFKKDHDQRRSSATTAASSPRFGSAATTSTDSNAAGSGAASWWDPAGADQSRPRSSRRPSVVSTTGSMPGSSGPAASRLVPTNTIKLEFSNYARVEVVRRGVKGHYDFEWWGHKYTWRRVVDKDLGVASFHLIRDGRSGSPVAHVVPEVRSPTQVEADEEAGGWVPPCYLWISDPSIVEAVTDVADVIVATGLIALVDDSIKERWSSKKPPVTRRLSHSTDVEGSKLLRPRALFNNLFQRRHSEQYTSSPLRAVAAH